MSAILNTTIGRVPPGDLDAEAAVLSACLLDQSALDRVQAILQPKHFYADANRRIYEAIIDLATSGKPIDIVSVASWLREREKLQQVGGSPYLAQISDATPATAHVEHHAQTIVDRWSVRQVIYACQCTATEGYGDIGLVTDWLQEVDARMYAVTRRDTQSSNVAILGVAASEETERIRERKASGGKVVRGITTGMPTLDARIGNLQRGNKYTIGARSGMGKAQPLDVKVLTPTGWRLMGELKVGDLVIGADGKPTRVAGVYDQGVKQVYRVVMDDGGSTRCCDEHLWLTRTYADRSTKSPGTIKSLSEIRKSLRRTSGHHIHSIPYMRPARLKPVGQLPMDPYLLGVYLGDGDGRGRISNPEKDIQASLKRLAMPGDVLIIEDDGLSLSYKKKIPSTRIATAFMRAIRVMGLDGCRAETKFIPEPYLRASVADRIRLLQGLCDTDGYVPTGRNVELSTASHRMSQEIVELVGSLGGTCSVKKRKTHYTTKGKQHAAQDSYRMVMRFPVGNVTPVSSKKHLARWGKPGPSRITERFIHDVVREGRQRCRCIRIESKEQLYVTDDYIVTHNTGLLLTMGLAAARKGHGVVICSLEMPRDQLALRALAQQANIDSSKLGRGRITDEQFKELVGACVELGKLPIVIFDQSKQTVSSVRACVREGRRLLRERYGAHIEVEEVLVDFLQIMDAGERATGNDVKDLQMLSLGLAQLAKDENCVVLEATQLNRDLEKRPRDDRRPKIPDIRGAGGIEEQTFGIFFIYRDDKYKKEGEERDNKAELIVAKLRQGGAEGTVHVKFKPETTLFYETSRNPDIEQLGDMFDDYLPGSYNETDDPPRTWQDQYDK